MTATASTDLDRAVGLFHALSDATRLSALDMLRDGEKCVCELQDRLDIAQSRLSFHLKVLKDARLVTDLPEGTSRVYQLDPAGFESVRAYLDQFWTTALAAFKERADAEPTRDDR